MSSVFFCRKHEWASVNSGLDDRGGTKHAHWDDPGQLGQVYHLKPCLMCYFHPQTPEGRIWKYFIPLLVLAFVVRAALALYTDSILHVDEIFQYLEQGHRLAFGNGVVPWEHFYGVRPLMLPWLIAGTLLLCDVLSLGQPFWYIGAVKLLFCAISLLIPAGMYFFARRHFGETTGQISLLAGVFWYELAGFAHKPLAELVTTALLLAALAIMIRPTPDKRENWLAVFLLVMVTAFGFNTPRWYLYCLACLFFSRKRKYSSLWLSLLLWLLLASLMQSPGTAGCFTRISTIYATIKRGKVLMSPIIPSTST